MKARLSAIEYYLPESVLGNESLAKKFVDWTSEKIFEKTGIRQRHIAGPAECSSDLAVRACEKLFASGACGPKDVDFLLLCTQSPDYFLPTTACLVQDRLAIPQGAGALDINLGCSGYVYSLGLAKGIIETGQARRVLVVTAETYSKFIHDEDRSARTIFGDAAAATLIEGVETASPEDLLGPFVYGTDGGGAQNLIVTAGGMRNRVCAESQPNVDRFANKRSDENLFMNGGAIFNFTLQVIPQAVQSLLDKAHYTLSDVDLIVFHQANKFILDHLRKKMNIPEEKFVLALADSGNTVSATIPIALAEVVENGRLKDGQRVMLAGFGVGYSWGAALVEWRGA